MMPIHLLVSFTSDDQQMAAITQIRGHVEF